jgi:hypothetical protein
MPATNGRARTVSLTERTLRVALASDIRRHAQGHDVPGENPVMKNRCRMGAFRCCGAFTSRRDWELERSSVTLASRLPSEIWGPVSLSSTPLRRSSR